MSSSTVPYMANPAAIPKIFEKIKGAATPENFNSDFLSTKLGFKGGNNRQFIPWAKKLGLIDSNGAPTQLYKKFRNPTTSRVSLAQALRNGYAELYSRNEYCHELDKSALKGLIMEATGLPHDSQVLLYMVNSFFHTKALADFDALISDSGTTESSTEKQSEKPVETSQDHNERKIHLGLNYTINLVLPKTDDPAIYNAIFKSLRENLLKN